MDINLISVLILSYNNQQYILETIDSVLMQDYFNIEIIIADDGTEDFDKNFYEEYIKKNKGNNINNFLIYTNKVNLGTVKNINKAIRLSKGKYIKPIASDDALYSKTILSQVVEYFEKQQSLIITTKIQVCDYNLEEVEWSSKKMDAYEEKLLKKYEDGEFFKSLAWKCWIEAAGIFFRKEFFDVFGLFDESYKLIEDWPMWLKITRDDNKIDYFNIISTKYRLGSGVSTQKKVNSLFENDQIKCYEKEILPYRNKLGYWTHKRIKWEYIRSYKLREFSMLKKAWSICTFTDVLLTNRISKMLNH